MPFTQESRSQNYVTLFFCLHATAFHTSCVNWYMKDLQHVVTAHSWSIPRCIHARRNCCTSFLCFQSCINKTNKALTVQLQVSQCNIKPWCVCCVSEPASLNSEVINCNLDKIQAQYTQLVLVQSDLNTTFALCNTLLLLPVLLQYSVSCEGQKAEITKW